MPNSPPARTDKDEAVILVKAAPNVGARRGETVCCAGVSRYNEWVRLYPVAFRTLEETQKFSRWDIISYKWRAPQNDQREESRRVDQGSIEIISKLAKSERQPFLAPMVKSSLQKERDAGKSFALLEADIIDFIVELKEEAEFAAEQEVHEAVYAQADLLLTKQLVPYSPCPFLFKYRYKSDDGVREGTCQDWEIEATFFRRRKSEGEAGAIRSMRETFGEDYPKRGMLLAMGTHSRWPDTWLINGVIRLDKIAQSSLL